MEAKVCSYCISRKEHKEMVHCVVCKFPDLPVLGGQGRRKQRCIKRQCIDVWLYNSGSDTAQCICGQPLQQREVCTIRVSTDYASNLLPSTHLG